MTKVLVVSGSALTFVIALLCACTSEDGNSKPPVATQRAALLTPVTVNVFGDTYLKSGSPNQNQGSEPIIRLQSSGKNRGLLFFDKAAIQSAVGNGTLVSARLELVIDSSASNWGVTGRPIAVHRLLQASSEYEASWNCAADASIYNSQADCSGATAWSMDASDPASRPWQQTATATSTIVNNQTGIVSFDVTADVAAMQNGSWPGHGFLVKKVDESQSGQVDFVARERARKSELHCGIDLRKVGWVA